MQEYIAIRKMEIERNMFTKIRILLLSVGITTLMASSVFAGSWGKDAKGWWYLNDDGTYAKSGWKWIDGNGDCIAERYYFDSDGYLLTNTVTPDGEKVNEDGAWVKYDIVQRKISSKQNAYIQPGIYYQQSAVVYWNDFGENGGTIHGIRNEGLDYDNTITVTGSGNTLSFKWRPHGTEYDSTPGTFTRKTDGSYDIEYSGAVDGFESINGIGAINDSSLILENWEEGAGSADAFYIMVKA